jgi:hypothetical protein
MYNATLFTGNVSAGVFMSATSAPGMLIAVGRFAVYLLEIFHLQTKYMDNDPTLPSRHVRRSTTF